MHVDPDDRTEPEQEHTAPARGAPRTPPWQSYQAVYPLREHTVSGDVRVLRDVAGQGIAPRDLLVYLPPSYATHPTRRYPVLYLQDGQNVFDAATSFAGEWGADEAAEALAAHGLETILVAVPNGGGARAAEYSPWPLRPAAAQGETQAGAYLDYLLETVKPCIDAAFRTSPAPARTGIAGSSLGGLISLYACLARPGTFGFCAALSPALWPARGRVFRFAQEQHCGGMRVYLDAGGREGGQRYLSQVRRMRDLLRHLGDEVAYVEEPLGQHDEAAWRRRFPAVLAWFLDPRRTPPS